MSREELVGAYVDGHMGRRVFISGLVALGVSAAAAVTYADSLSAATIPTTTSTTDIYNPTSSTTSTTTSTSTTAGGAVSADQAGKAAAVPAAPTFTG